MRVVTRAGGKLSLIALAQVAPRTLRCVLCPSVGPSLPMRMIELVRMGVGLKASKMAEWIIIQGHLVGKKADDR